MLQGIMESRDKRIIIPLNAAELEALDNWRFDKHMPSRAEAVRKLLLLGMIDE
ncbi:hypothetical protein LCGC14_2210450 [marine sediment metagenome]|uniref:Uncharacterized protein n=1 Tax=marine sediment metagenome TaxID=412755 RepID=A0A0F9DE42_9ZZZZ